MAINKIEIQNSVGDIYYPHTSSDVVKHGSRSLSAFLTLLENKFKSYLPLAGGTLTGDLTIRTTTSTDSSKYLTLQDSSGKRRIMFSTSSGSAGLKIHTCNSTGAFVNSLTIDEDGTVHIGNGKINKVLAIAGRESDISIEPKKGTGYDGGLRIGWTGSTTIGGPRFELTPMNPNDLRVGSQANPMHTVFGRNAYITVSDRNAKENIQYIDEGINLASSVDKSTKLTKEDFYDFFKNEIRFASYDMKGAKIENLETNFGFIAQDIVDTKIGSKIVMPPIREIQFHNEDGTIDTEQIENSMFSFSTGNFATATAIALQKAIEKIESLEEKIKLLEKKINALVS